MIKINKDFDDIPDVLKTKGKEETLKLYESVDSGHDRLDFKSSIFGHESVKKKLIEIQNDKCCFCESKVTSISYGDIEHFRPKAGYQQHDQETLNRPGYYWLAYDWSNLLFSCEVCNRRFKRNLFPLLNPQKRAKNHKGDITAEKPVFIDPSKDDPQKWITFNQEIPVPINNNERAKTTIEELGLDREKLNEARRERYLIVMTLLKYCRDDWEAADVINDYLKESSSFSAMVRVAVDKYSMAEEKHR